MVSIDDGMAEGVYAASGSSSASIGISGPNVINNWGTSGQSTLSLDLNQMKLSQENHSLYTGIVHLLLQILHFRQMAT